MAKKSIAMQSLDMEEEDLVFLDEQQETGLSYWEFVNQSDADSDTESLVSIENGFVSWYTLSSNSPPKSPLRDQEMDTQVVIHEKDLVCDVNSNNNHVSFYGYYQPQAGHVIDDDDDDDDDGYGLDDELVPWSVGGKLGRQRMRKLGKRVFAKMGNSKRSPFLHVKPGAVHGKHGLGLKA